MDVSKINIWKEFAEITGGKLIEPVSWHSGKTEIEYRNLKIVFDYYTLWSGKYSTVMTRAFISFVSADNFKFEIYRNGIIRRIEKLFGAQDVEIGRSEFDKAFIIKTNNEFKIKKLLNNQKVRNHLENLKELNIQICDQYGIWEHKLPEKELQLSFFADGKVSEIETLKIILELIKEMTDELFEMKSIIIN